MVGLRGRLISASFAESELRALPWATPPPAAAVRALDRWSDRCAASLGPASSVRAIADVALIPLLRILGFEIGRRVDRGAETIVEAAASPTAAIPVVVLAWNVPLGQAWRDAVLDGISADARWCLCSNGAALRLVDAQHTWSRRHLEFDLALLAHDDGLRTVLWTLARAEAMAARPPLLDRAAELSARHGVAVCRSLGTGVLEALTALFRALATRSRRAPEALFEQSLTVVYRVLFLLFAEARGLVPIWHPVYRERYTIDALVSSLLTGRRSRGVWEAILAISRLAHAGCRAGELTVTPFNGRLFSPVHSTAFDETRIGDEVMSDAIVRLATTRGPGGERARIRYGDLDVEQLGAVYERVLEYEPIDAGTDAGLTRTRDGRRSSGTFYTPRPVTAFLVGRTLEPLVRGRTADEILRLRVLDPAMGSGAFLVAACRYLATAAEASLIREGTWHQDDVTAADRAALRREIAQRCLFGVDINPMAVQLARLSLWLATLAADRPLTFLDHHLAAGNSLVGATMADILRQPTRGPRTQRRLGPLPLFADLDTSGALEHAVRTRLRLAVEPDDSPATVSAKEKTLAALRAPGSTLERWSRVLDLWCAGWFWEDGAPPEPGVFGALCDRVLHDRDALPAAAASRLLAHAAVLAARHRFLHWPLTFPEVFADDRGEPLAAPGFDAVVGNPPWDMLRGDSGDAPVRAERKRDARRLVEFAREAGVYRVEARAHINRYQLFVERALQLTRAGGRIGLVLPSGIATDAGAAPLRRHLFDHADVDGVFGLDNRAGLFPIHRSLRFVLLTCTAGRPTSATACRFGMSGVDDLEADRRPLLITRAFLARLSGSDDLGLPEIATERDLRILEHISAHCPWLGAPPGWQVRFGRELNASDDRGLFRPFSGRAGARPVLEGKQLEPFRVAVDSCRYELAASAGARHAGGRARLAYRDVASATNRLTLIAAVVPARAVTTHTLFCLKTRLSTDAQHVLCALFNSFVANYLVRLRVNTHVTASLVSRLPVPVVAPHDPAFARLASLSRILTDATAPLETMPEYAELQAIAARLYRLSEADFEHVLGTFPLIPDEVKRRVLMEFSSRY
ncbi:MAG: N-6 DNA methylase [Acidobacteria bacterium]|nr:N-6 DNA methylase [Acidobacteriota bacterium]